MVWFAIVVVVATTNTRMGIAFGSRTRRGGMGPNSVADHPKGCLCFRIPFGTLRYAVDLRSPCQPIRYGTLRQRNPTSGLVRNHPPTCSAFIILTVNFVTGSFFLLPLKIVQLASRRCLCKRLILGTRRYRPLVQICRTGSET